mgnify:CR=1 FL=1
MCRISQLDMDLDHALIANMFLFFSTEYDVSIYALASRMCVNVAITA